MVNRQPKQPTDEAMKAKAVSRWEGEGGAPAEGRKSKLPRDLDQSAKRTVDLATERAPVGKQGSTKKSKPGNGSP